MNTYSVELYRRLQQTDVPPGWVEAGGIRLASSQERMEEIRRQIGWARTFDLPLEEISAAEAQQMFPLLDPSGVVGGAYLPSDGWIDPSMLCQAMATLARRSGVTIATHTRVVGIDAERRRVCGVRTDKGDVECEIVVNAGGMFAAQIGRLAGVRIPVVPMSHQYLVTDAFLTDHLDGRDHRAEPLPTLRDPDLLVYYRQEGDGLVMGGYERDAEAFCTTSTSYDQIPADFNGKLLPESWDRLEEIAHNGQLRVPAMADVGIKTMVNGPEAFTPDNEFCLGETEVDGLFVAAGFCAHGIAGAGGIGRLMADWVLDGEPGMDVWHMDVRRFGSQYGSPSYTLERTRETYETYYDITYPAHERSAGRPLRTSPGYGWHQAHGAVFGEKAGWERVNYYADNEEAGDESLRPHGWAGRHWSPATGAEHLGTRAAAGLFDESSFAKIEVSGPDSAELLEWVCDNHVAREVGAVTYTQLLNSGGGIEADLTVTRTAEDAFLVVTGTAYGSRDLDWLRRQARRRDAAVRIADVTGQQVCYALWGPRSREILGGPDHCRPRQHRVPVPHRTADHRRRRARARAAGDVHRRARVGAVRAQRVRPAAVAAAVGRRPRARAGRGRLPRDRQPAAGEGLPVVEHRRHPGDDAVRGRPRLLRGAGQARWFPRPGGAAGRQGPRGPGRFGPAAALPGARRPAAGGGR